MPWYEYSIRGQGIALPLAEVRLWHAGRSVRLTALVDSGADFSLVDVRVADALGLDHVTATVSEATGAGGAMFDTYRWPAAQIELGFESERFPFLGAFAAFPADADLLSLLGRRDFFERFIVQF
jgi:hypothetical protein